ncbi:unnamed protein product [Chilo suppressalis]|uniref:FP protein C-terminal domain-containing protein n=1 Tax=Chilo suppressalis TaxID=168631 RepID=A0ABN8B496_CHISP|nr:unnamed protein product [Chilo suppressalis]
MNTEGNTNVVLDGDLSISLSDGDGSPITFVTQRSQRKNVNNDTNTSLGDQFNIFRDEMKKLMTSFTTSSKQELKDLSTILKEIKESNHSIESSIAYLTAQNEEYKNRIASLENCVKEDRKYIVLLEEKLEDIQIGNRKTNFELKNVPKKPEENKQDLIDMVVCFSNTIDCQINRSDIKDIYRLRGKKPDQKNTSIIVETTSALLKADVLKMAKSFNKRNKTKLCAKHLGFKTNEDTPIFLSEHLTARGSRLHYLARDLAKSKGYKFCWTAYGKVYVRVEEKSPTILIRSEEQVHSLLSKD